MEWHASKQIEVVQMTVYTMLAFAFGFMDHSSAGVTIQLAIQLEGISENTQSCNMFWWKIYLNLFIIVASCDPR
jgi:hypothetical protein